MRKALCAAVVLSLGLALPTQAQQRKSSFAPISPSEIKFTPIDTSKLNAPMPAPPSQPFSLKNYMPSWHWPSFLGGTPAGSPKPTTTKIATKNQ